MSKKKFKDSLDSLFGASMLESFEENAVLTETTIAAKPIKKNKKHARKKASSSKSFSANLEALFTNVLTEAISEATTTVEEKKANVVEKADTPDKAVGLDILIRQTIETSTVVTPPPKAKKRVTFVFDKKKLLKLKSIAKFEKAYLKDIIGGLVSEYIDEYEDENGGVEPLPVSPKKK